MDSGKIGDAVMFDCPDCEYCSDTKNGLKVHYGCSHQGSMAGVELECENCGDTYRKRKDRVDESRFCDIDCKADYQSDKIKGKNNMNWLGGKDKGTCIKCGNTFKRESYRMENAKFCSQECNTKYLKEDQVGKNHPHWKSKIEKDCENCGDVMKLQPSKGNRKFCSRECMGKWQSNNYLGENNPAWNGGYDVYSTSEWRKIRKEVLESRQEKCKSCGMSRIEHKEKYGRDIEVHHIKPIRKHENPNIKTNLVILCKDCHREIEKLSVTEQEKELGLMQWREAV